MSQNVVLMDIDGVLSPLDPIPESIETFVVRSDYGTWVIRKSIAEWFVNLTKQVKIVWASKWNESCRDLDRALGIEPLEYVEFSDDDVNPVDPDQWVKFNSVKNFLKDHDYEKIVWVDDEIDSEAQELAADEESIALVKPDSGKGLLLKDVLAIHKALDLAP